MRRPRSPAPLRRAISRRPASSSSGSRSPAGGSTRSSACVTRSSHAGQPAAPSARSHAAGRAAREQCPLRSSPRAARRAESSACSYSYRQPGTANSRTSPTARSLAQSDTIASAISTVQLAAKRHSARASWPARSVSTPAEAGCDSDRERCRRQCERCQQRPWAARLARHLWPHSAQPPCHPIGARSAQPSRLPPYAFDRAFALANAA